MLKTISCLIFLFPVFITCNLSSESEILFPTPLIDPPIHKPLAESDTSLQTNLEPPSYEFNAKNDIPLPNKLEPISYELVLLTHVEKVEPIFEGHVHITVRCVEKTDEIILNIKNQFIRAEKVEVWAITKAGERFIQVEGHRPNVDHKFDWYSIKLKDYLEENNNYKITIYFSKYLNSMVSGYIDVSYRDQELHHDLKHIAYTKVNEIDARTIFPSFDNLNSKATFKIKIGHASTARAITNSEFIYSRRMSSRSGWVMDEFAEIKNPLSTFSLAAAVVDFEFIKTHVQALGSNRVMSTNIEIRVSAEQDILNNMNEILKVASKSFLYFSRFFDVPYELKKLELIVLPDPRVDILGYYGLIYLGRNNVVKFFKKKFDQYTPVKFTVTSQICHVMSTQWIGHSATMSSWKETWLHVGLNKYLEKFCVDDLFPNWKISTERNIMKSFLDLLKTEERGDFNPIALVGSDFPFTESSANDETISKIHHTIRMLSFILRWREENSILQTSIKNYLELYKSKNSNLHDLWEIFTSTANEEGQILPKGITIQGIMESWLGKRGHPLIKVNRNVGSNKIIVTQEPFGASNNGELKENQQPCWIIPLRYRIKHESQKTEGGRIREWLRCDGQPLVIDVKDGDWILFNLNLHVPARVTYDVKNWLLIHELLKNNKLYSSIELSARMHLISDMFALAEAEKLSYEFVFSTMKKYLIHEKSHQCWTLAYEEMVKIRSRLIGTKMFEPFQSYVRSIVKPIFEEEIENIEKFVKSDRRSNLFENIIIKTICTFEDPKCQKYGEKLLENWFLNNEDKNRDLIPQDLVESVICLAVKNADDEKWEFLYAKATLDNGMLNPLGCSSNTNILRKFLIYGTFVKRGNISPILCLKVFESLLSNELGYAIIKESLRLGTDNLSQHLLHQGKFITIEDIFAKVYEAAKADEMLKEVVSYYSQVKTRIETKEKLLEESMLKARKNVSWLQKYETPLSQYLENLINS